MVFPDAQTGMLLAPILKMSDLPYQFSPGQIFILLFIMLGPFRFIGPYSLLAAKIPKPKKKVTAIKTGAIAFLSLTVGAFLGSRVLSVWGMRAEMMVLAAGILFFLASLKNLRGVKESPPPPHITKPSEIAFRKIITSYGMATVIVLVSTSHNLNQTLIILGCLFAVMLINTLFMAFIKPKRTLNPGLIPRIFMTSLGALQFALSIKIVLGALANLKILPT